MRQGVKGQLTRPVEDGTEVGGGVEVVPVCPPSPWSLCPFPGLLRGNARVWGRGSAGWALKAGVRSPPVPVISGSLLSPAGAGQGPALAS